MGSIYYDHVPNFILTSFIGIGLPQSSSSREPRTEGLKYLVDLEEYQTENATVHKCIVKDHEVRPKVDHCYENCHCKSSKVIYL